MRAVWPYLVNGHLVDQFCDLGNILLYQHLALSWQNTLDKGHIRRQSLQIALLTVSFNLWYHLLY